MKNSRSSMSKRVAKLVNYGKRLRGNKLNASIDVGLNWRCKKLEEEMTGD